MNGMTDSKWKLLVLRVAKGEHDQDELNIAKNYLWFGDNYKRLGETLYGKFLREVVTPCPDLLLRTHYRKEITNG